MRTHVAIAALAACAASAGCAKKDGAPSCGIVGARFFAIATSSLAAATLDDDTRRSIGDQIPAMRDTLVGACTDSTWSAEVRQCLVDAVDQEAFVRCEDHLDQPQHDALDRAARGDTASP